MIIEKNRKAFCLSDDCNEKTILSIVEEQDGWKLLAIGWEYSHWNEIGERGGLAEAGELNIDGRIKTSFEHYIQVYRHLFKQVEPVHHLFKSFEVTATVKLEPTDKEWLTKKKREIIADFDFTEIHPNSFEKVLLERHYPIFKKGYCTYSFHPIGAIEVVKPKLAAEQISLF